MAFLNHEFLVAVWLPFFQHAISAASEQLMELQIVISLILL